MTDRRRTGVLLRAVGIALLAVGAVAVPGRAADSNPADDLLDRARHAVRNLEFHGTVRIWWRDAKGGQNQTVAVAAVGGELQIAGGKVLEDSGRSWVAQAGGWQTLWADANDTKDANAPNLARKYTVIRRAGPMVVQRSTTMLVIRRGGHDVEQIEFDRVTGIVLGRDRFDVTGAPTYRMEFVTLTGVRVRRGQAAVPKIDAEAPGRVRAAPADTARALTGGFVLVDARRMNASETQLRYSDGVFEASVFAQSGALDWSSLPAGGSDVRYGSVRARRYRSAAGTVMVWQAGDRTLTCVTDARDDDALGIVESLSRSSDSDWTTVVRFVTGPFSWR